MANVLTSKDCWQNLGSTNYVSVKREGGELVSLSEGWLTRNLTVEHRVWKSELWNDIYIRHKEKQGERERERERERESKY